MGERFLLLLLVFSFFGSSFIYASQMPPFPVCEVEAEIVDFQAYRNVDIKILSVGEMLDEGYLPYENFTCKDYYLGDIIESVTVPEGNYGVGQTITAQVWYGGDEFSQGYWLENITTLLEPDIYGGFPKESSSSIVYYIGVVILIILIMIYFLMRKKGMKRIRKIERKLNKKND